MGFRACASVPAGVAVACCRVDLLCGRQKDAAAFGGVGTAARVVGRKQPVRHVGPPIAANGLRVRVDHFRVRVKGPTARPRIDLGTLAAGEQQVSSRSVACGAEPGAEFDHWSLA